jgi:hypothetical protein
MTRILTDIALGQVATGAQTGTVSEPSLAVSGKRMLVAGNWFSSRSTDGGSTWTFVDPYTELPTTGAGVCCDQLVHYSKSRRLWIWLLQFRKSATGNIVRVAVSWNGAPGSWTWWDTAPSDVDPAWTNLWFDYPDLVETADRLLLSFNMYGVANDRWERAVVLRFSLDDLKARGTLPRQAWSTDQVGSLRFARGPGNGAVFASQSNSVAGIVLFEWPDAATTVTETAVAVTDWSDGPYQSNGPGGAPWLNRLDDRITGGWRANGVLGFAWSAAADANHPHPFIRVVRIDEATETLIDEPDLWSAACAWAYPAMIANRRGDVGITAFCGGMTSHPAHAVGWFDERAGSWDMTTGAISTHGPRDGVWGDYLDIQPDPRRITYWVASGFVLNGGSARTNVEPRVVTFKP